MYPQLKLGACSVGDPAQPGNTQPSPQAGSSWRASRDARRLVLTGCGCWRILRARQQAGLKCRSHRLGASATPSCPALWAVETRPASAGCQGRAGEQRVSMASVGVPDGRSWPYPCRLSRDSAGTMARSKNGQAIRESQRTARKLVQLDEFIQEACAQSDLATWRRGRAVFGPSKASSGGADQVPAIGSTRRASRALHNTAYSIN